MLKKEEKGQDINANSKISRNGLVLKAKRSKLIILAHQRRKQTVTLDTNLRQILRRQRKQSLVQIESKSITLQNLQRNNSFQKITSLPQGILMKQNPQKRASSKVRLMRKFTQNNISTQPCSRFQLNLRSENKKERKFISNKQKFLGKKVTLHQKIIPRKFKVGKNSSLQFVQKKQIPKMSKILKPSEFKESHFSGWAKQTQYNQIII